MPQDETLDAIFVLGRLHVSISIAVTIMNIQFYVLVLTLNVIFQTLPRKVVLFRGVI